jgi:hypothetical protein
MNVRCGEEAVLVGGAGDFYYSRAIRGPFGSWSHYAGDEFRMGTLQREQSPQEVRHDRASARNATVAAESRLAGLFTRAAIDEIKGLHTVVGVYNDERHSAPIAKYSDPRRAADAASLVNRLAKAG